MMAELHNRMPMTLNSEDFDWWMTGKTEVVGQLLAPCPSENLKCSSVFYNQDSEQFSGWRTRPVTSGGIEWLHT